MQVRTPTELGALIRDYRRRHNLNQKSLAESVGVSRQWIVEIEKGKPRAEIALVLRTIDALGIALTAGETGKERRQSAQPPLNIDSIVSAARTKRK